MNVTLTAGQDFTAQFTDTYGSTHVRRLRVISAGYGVHGPHREAQWVLHALDLDTNETGTYPLRDLDPY